jgi:tRNA(Ile)-lysidine synthetase-like protein
MKASVLCLLMDDLDLVRSAIETVPPGRWVVGISGGVDSLALFCALHRFRPDIEVMLAHLNHESRGAESDADAEFVDNISYWHKVDLYDERLSRIAPIPTTGHEAAYRAARHELFALAMKDHEAQGVLLAHHADDRAETVMLRLLRGGEATAIDGLRRDATVMTANGELHIHRPLLGVRRATLKAFILAIKQPWREDASNASHDFARNRVRSFLKDRPALVEPLLKLADAADALRAWVGVNTPGLPETFLIEALGDLPDPLARAAARRWLIDRGSPAEEVTAEVAERLIEMCQDRAASGKQDFAGDVSVRRKAGRIEA